MTRKDIIDAYLRIRKMDDMIPDEVLDFMKDSALEKIKQSSESKAKAKIVEDHFRSDWFEEYYKLK